MELFHKAPKKLELGGRYVHFDLASRDPKATREFYESIFGWKFRHIPGADYWLVTAGAEPHSGLRKTEWGEASHMLGYISVPSLDAVEIRIKAAGGRIIGGRQEIPGFGASLLFEAPGGLVQAVFEERA